MKINFIICHAVVRVAMYNNICFHYEKIAQLRRLKMNKNIECILSGFDIPNIKNISEIKSTVWDIDNTYILKKIM